MSKKKRLLLLLDFRKSNMHSWASLVGALEASSIYDKVEIEIKAMSESPESTCKQAIVGGHDAAILAFSINSIESPDVLAYIKNLRHEIRTGEHGEARTFIIAGGPHATARPAQVQAAGADHVFLGEGEVSFPLYIDTIARWLDGEMKNPLLIEEIEGIANMACGTGQTQMNVARVAELDNYPPYAHYNRIFRPFEISRGCPHACAFCQTPVLFGRSMRHRSVDAIVKWLKSAAAIKYDKIWFTTPNAFAYGSKGSRGEPEKVEKLLKAVKGVDGIEKIFFGTFPSEIRPEFVTEAMMDAVLPHVANDTFIVGVQSASPRVLKDARRGHSAEDAWRAIDVITGRGCKIDVDMIFGLPTEEEEDVALTLEFIKQATSIKGVTIHGHVFMPLPGTAWEKERPGRMDPRLQSLVGRLARRGKVHGSHFVQARHARALARDDT